MSSFTPAEIQALKQLLAREQHAKKLSELPTRDTLNATDNIYVTSNQGDHRATIGTLLNTIPAPTWGLITNKPTIFPPSTTWHPPRNMENNCPLLRLTNTNWEVMPCWHLSF